MNSQNRKERGKKVRKNRGNRPMKITKGITLQHKVEQKQRSGEKL